MVGCFVVTQHSDLVMRAGYQHKCKELAQETCFNTPATVPRQEEVTLMVPTPSQECGPMQVEIPTVTCEEVREERCVKLPSLEEAQVEAQQCTVALAGQSCREVRGLLSTELSSSHNFDL